MEQQHKHTEGKWRISDSIPTVQPQVLNFKGYPENENVYKEINIYAESGQHICEKVISEKHLPEALANAELICKAVNSHFKLIEALDEQIEDREILNLTESDFIEIDGISAQQAFDNYVARTEELKQLLQSLKD